MEPPLWAFVVITITLVLAAIAINPLLKDIDEALQQDAYLQAQKIASIVNLAVSAPDMTIYRLDMPSSRCRLLITQGFVRLTITQATGINVTQVIGLIRTPTAVSQADINCRLNRNIELRKSGNNLEVSFRRS